MSLRTLRLLAMLCLLPFAAAAQDEGTGDCTASLERVALRGSENYEPFSRRDTVVPIEIVLAQEGDCQLAFTFRSDQGERLGGLGDGLVFRLQDGGGRAFVLDGVRLQRVEGQGRSDGQTRLDLYALIPGGQVARPGYYDTSIVVQLVGGEQVLDEQVLQLGIHVLPQVNIGVAGSAGAGFSNAGGATLDFGSLETGLERSVYLFVQSNGAYLMNLSSQNGGRMMRVGGGSGGGGRDWIDYLAWLDSRRLDLRTPYSFQPPLQRGRFEQRPFELRVRIGEVAGATAGEYRDVITVEVLVLE